MTTPPPNAPPSTGLDPGEPLPECLLPASPAHPAGTVYARHCGVPLRVIAWPAGHSLPPHADDHGPRLDLLPAGSPAPVHSASWLADTADGRVLRALAGTQWAAVTSPRAWQFDARLKLIGSCAPDAPVPADGTPEIPPPLLLVPGLLPPALCEALIAAHRRTHEDSPVHRRDAAGGVALQVDRQAKSRRDHLLSDAALLAEVARRIGRRLVPAIAQAMTVSVSRHETPKIVAYHAADGGHFAAHRDNVTADARHRRFALTVNLDGGYVGGGLQFPEFSAQPVEPPVGAGLVFSGSLLHRVLPVSAGSRHALVSFLW